MALKHGRVAQTAVLEPAGGWSLVSIGIESTPGRSKRANQGDLVHRRQPEVWLARWATWPRQTYGPSLYSRTGLALYPRLLAGGCSRLICHFSRQGLVGKAKVRSAWPVTLPWLGKVNISWASTQLGWPLGGS